MPPNYRNRSAFREARRHCAPTTRTWIPFRAKGLCLHLRSQLLNKPHLEQCEFSPWDCMAVSSVGLRVTMSPIGLRSEGDFPGEALAYFSGSVKNTKFYLLQIPESWTYISRGGILEGRASRPDAHLRSTRSRRSFETSAVWIAEMGAQNAAGSIGRSRPGNS